MSIKIGLIGGSGLGAALAERQIDTRPQFVNTPFGQPSATILETRWAGVDVCVLARHGRGHTINPTHVPYRANIYALKVLGCTHLLASGAVGSLREEFRPRDLVIPDNAIDKTFRRAGTFYERAAVHVDFAEPFCPVLRQILQETGADLVRKTGALDAPLTVHNEGCYVAMEGPAFSTRAESLMHRLWGGDLIGMTAMPEAKLAREAELPYALIALVTDYDSWRAIQPAPRPAPARSTTATEANSTEAQLREGAPAPAVDLTFDEQSQRRRDLSLEIVENLKTATENGIRLMQATLERIAADPSALDRCPARDALSTAIWSDQSKIEAEEIERLRPLWGRYF